MGSHFALKSPGRNNSIPLLYLWFLLVTIVRPFIICVNVSFISVSAVIYSICEDFQLDFYAMYGCVGLWSSFFLVLYSLFDVSRLMRWSTRSTEEIFALFISIAFCVDAFRDTVKSKSCPPFFFLFFSFCYPPFSVGDNCVVQFGSGPPAYVYRPVPPEWESNQFVQLGKSIPIDRKGRHLDWRCILK